MRIDKQLTSNDGIMSVAGMAVVDEYNSDVPSALTSAKAIEEWAGELEDIEGRLEVSIQNLEESESDETHKSLVVRAADTDVACVLAPIVPEEPSETDGAELGGDA